MLVGIDASPMFDSHALPYFLAGPRRSASERTAKRDHAALQEFGIEITRTAIEGRASACLVERVEIRPRNGDIAVTRVAVVWSPTGEV